MVPYRTEAIIALPLGEGSCERIWGHEILRGAVHAPRIWRPRRNWRRWYRRLFEQILPVEIARHPGLAFVNLYSDQILDPAIQSTVGNCPFADRVVLEWVERPASVRRIGHAGAVFQALRASGFLLAIDDVGAPAQTDWGAGRRSRPISSRPRAICFTKRART